MSSSRSVSPGDGLVGLALLVECASVDQQRDGDEVPVEQRLGDSVKGQEASPVRRERGVIVVDDLLDALEEVGMPLCVAGGVVAAVSSVVAELQPGNRVGSIRLAAAD